MKRAVIQTILVGSAFVWCAPLFAEATEPAVALQAPAPAQALATQLQDALTKRDAKALAALFDVSAFAARVNAKVPADARLPEGPFANVIVEASNSLMTAMDQGSIVSLLRIHQVDADERVLLRITGPSGVTYFDFVVGQNAGAVKASDVYTTGAGELLSQRLAFRIARASLAQANTNSKFMEEVEIYAKMAEALDNRDPKTVLDMYEKLDTFKNDRATQVMRLQAACAVSDAATLDKVSAEFLKAYPGDISGSLAMVDGYTVLQQYDKVVESIDAIDKAVGGDPYLEYLRANNCAIQKDNAGAKKHLESGLNADPTLEDLSNRMMDYAVVEKNNAEIKRWLLHLEKFNDYQFQPNLNDVEAFGDFKKSPEYQAWLKEKKQ